MSKVVLKNVKKKYPNQSEYAVKDFNIEIDEGELIVFVGPSGCGKSTTLRMIAGLEDISEGELIIEGKVVNKLSPKDRDIAMVFQSYALYPHMSVKDNIGYGLKLRNQPKQEITQKVNDVANYLGLNELLDRKPKDMSGGQRQRVALGRAMIRTPKLYLMDEPLSNLDAKLRTVTRTEIAKLHREKGVVTIYVTHDQVEAMTMADRIVVMSVGEIQQIGSPKELYKNPKNLFVATFIGQPEMNIVEGEFTGTHFKNDLFNIELTDEDREILLKEGYENKRVIMGVRPQHIKDDDIYRREYAQTKFTISPINIEYLGDHVNIFFDANSKNYFVAKVSSSSPVEVNKPYDLFVKPTRLYFFDIDSKESITYHTRLLSYSNV